MHDSDLKRICFLCTTHFNRTGFKGFCVRIPVLVSAACPEGIIVLAAVTVAAATGATDTDAASMPDRCPVWGFASNCWASGSACNKCNSYLEM